MPFERAVQSLHCTWKKTTTSSVLNKGIKWRPSSKRVGVKKKSPNKSGYILRLSEGNFGAIRLEEAPQQVVIAPEMLGARRLNTMPTKPKPLNSMIAWSKWPFNGFRSINGALNWLAFEAMKPAFAPLATNVSINGCGRVSMATSAILGVWSRVESP